MAHGSSIIYGMRYIYAEGSMPTDEVHIIGHGFGTDPGTVYLLPIKPDSQVPIISWTDNKIVISYTGEKNETAVFNSVRVILATGGDAVDYSKPLDFGVPKKDKAWTVTSSEQDLVTGEVTILGTDLLNIVDAFFVDGSGTEYHPEILVKTPSQIVLKYPTAAPGPLTKLLLVGKNQSGNKLAGEDLEAAVIDVNKDEPGFVGWVAPAPPVNRTNGLGILVTGVPSDIQEVLVKDSNSNVVSRTVFPPSANPSTFRSRRSQLTTEAHYEDFGVLSELRVFWPDVTYPDERPAGYTNPVTSLELIPSAGAPIVVNPLAGEDWSFDLQYTSLEWDDVNKELKINGKHIFGVSKLQIYVAPVAPNTGYSGPITVQSLASIAIASNNNNSITKFIDDDSVTYNHMGTLLGGGGDYHVTRVVMETQFQGNFGDPATIDVDLSGSPFLMTDVNA